MITVREWRKEDLGAMIAMGAEMHIESPYYRDIPYQPESLIRIAKIAEKASDVLTALIAEDGDTMLGFMVITIQPYFFSDAVHCADLLLYVKPIYRLTTPAGKMLIQAAEKWGFEHGATECRFGETTGVMPEAVAKLYEKLGYHQGGTLYVKRTPSTVS